MTDLESALHQSCVDDLEDKASENACRDFLLEQGREVDEFSLHCDQIKAFLMRSFGVPRHIMEGRGG